MISTLFREPARIAAMRASPAGLRRLLEKAPDLVGRCQKFPGLTRRHWDGVQKMAEAAAWPIEDLKECFSLVLSMTGVCLRTAETLREGLEEAGGSASDLSTLNEVANALRALRSEVSGVWVWLTAPPKGRTRRTTAEIRDGITRGEYISVEEAFAEATGSLPEKTP